MGDITLPITFTDGNRLPATKIMRNLYHPLSGNSLEVINGNLDDSNLASGTTIASSAIRQGALSRGGMVGLTTNLDYVKEAFADDIADTDAFVMIPGACQEFHIHHSGVAILTWFLSVGSDLANEARDLSIRLFLDGAFVAGREFPLPQSTLPVDAMKVEKDTTIRRPSSADRIISGHHLMTDLEVGWHNAGLGIYSSAGLTRVRVRHFGWAWFR
jgi:hypothetical protein